MPVAVRDDVSFQNLQWLIAEGLESETLDYKSSLDLSVNDELLEIVKDIAAMQIRGGYIVIGADDYGAPSGKVTEAHRRLFEQASFRAKLLKFFDEPLGVQCRDHEIDGNIFILISVAPQPDGFAILRALGQNSRGKMVFKPGEVYSRHGTASEVWKSSDMAIIKQEIKAREKERWMAESTERLAALVPSAVAGKLAAAPVGAFNWDLDSDSFAASAVELIRNRDLVPIKMLITGIRRDVSSILSDDEGAERVKTVLDRLTCLAALSLRLSQEEVLRSSVEGFVAIYGLPDPKRNQIQFERALPPYMLWFEIVQRIAAVGSLAVRLERWEAIPVLVLNNGKGGEYSYYPNWYRHALTQAARANVLGQRQAGAPVESLLSFALKQLERLDCARFDLPDGDPEIFNSLCQFDLLAAVVAVGQAKDASHSTYYPSFSRYGAERVRSVVEDMIVNTDMRQKVFPLGDQDFATTLHAINHVASREPHSMWWSEYFGSDKVRNFVEENLSSEQ